MKFDIDISDLRRALKEEAEDIQEQARGAMQAATTYAKRELRDQVIRAGLGTRLAATWQDKVYPERRRTTEPTGWVYSRAPKIIEPYATGAEIRPLAGRQYLWIPTKNVPRKGARGGGRLYTPEEVESKYNQDLIFRPSKRTGNILVFVSRRRAKLKRGGFRKVRTGRLAYGESGELVLMWTLIRATSRPKKLDLDGVADRAAGIFARLMESK